MRKYDAEFKQLAVNKVFDGQSVAGVARELGVGVNLIHGWKKARLSDETNETAALERELSEVKKKLREAEMERDILKRRHLIARQTRIKRYAFIKSERGNFPLRALCRAMRVHRSNYAAWAAGKTPQPSERCRLVRAKVKACCERHRRRYGRRRIAAELADEGVSIGRAMVRAAMKAENLQAICPKKFVPKTTDSKHGQLASPNLLAVEANQPQAKAQVIIGEITYLPLANGQWCYLAIWQDKFTRQIVGWAVADSMTASLVIKAFDKAMLKGLIAAGSDYSHGQRFAICGDGFSRSTRQLQIAAINEWQRKLL